MPNITHVQIFGERCSGTNYLENLLINNFDDLEITWRFGWKHYFPEGALVDTSDCLFVVIHRDPFDWLRSFHKKPHHAAPALRKLSFSKFIRHEWHCEWGKSSKIDSSDARYGTEMMGERDPATGLRFRNVIRLRNAKIRRWNQLREEVEHIEFIRYESLLDDPNGWLESLGKKFDLKKKSIFTGVDTYKGRGEKAFKPKHYHPLNLSDIDFIESQLNYNLEHDLGYDIDVLTTHHRKQKSGLFSLLSKIFTGMPAGIAHDSHHLDMANKKNI